MLVKMQAATVNRTDCHLLTGKPLFMRLVAGFFKPRLATTGTVETIRKNIISFKPGDKVMGFSSPFLKS